MRVIAGSLKGRRLETPTWTGLRPTSDRLRETLFNMLAGRVPGARVLDAFAGTGALGIEALSRGAASAVFVERDVRAAALIERNAARCGVERRCAVIRADFVRSLAERRERFGPEAFDLVLLDPPYELPPEVVLQGVHAIVAPAGVVVLEHARRQPAPDVAGALVKTRDRRSGDSLLSFYAKAGDAG
jgi:16S rRNA (guanine(966)-N(2))-methyltransferase RsmD